MTAGSSNFVKLGVSAEACKYCYRARIQMLLILIETLDFESLLQLIHDEIPFRQVLKFDPSTQLNCDVAFCLRDKIAQWTCHLLLLL